MSTSSVRHPTYESIGVRPLINCMGTYTIISGSLMLPEVRRAMREASKAYVHLDELMEKVGARIADLMQCESGMVTSGCAAALCQVTAACVAGLDPDKMKRLPDTSGMKNRVITQPSHRHVYDHAIRMVGVQIVEVETSCELEAAVDGSTAMIAIFGDAADRGTITVPEIVGVARKHRVPTFVDAAAERPDVPNAYLSQGADVVAYSGGKCLRGPQASGLVLGRKDVLHAAFMNGAPHHALARPMKAGKEEVMGLLAAVEQWVRRDHDAEWKEWERRLETIAGAIAHVPTLATDVLQPGRSNVAPVLSINWDADTVRITPEEARRQLSDSDPRIELFHTGTGVEVMSYMMEDGEDEIVARRLRQVLEGALPA